MTSILYIEPDSGISGDMFLGALAPLLGLEDALRALPSKLGLAGVCVDFDDVVRSTIRCRKAIVHVPDHHHGQDSSHAQDHRHSHSHTHTHDHGHAHRHYSDIKQLISNSDLSSGTKEIAQAIFRLLAEAEATMHGTEIDEVHFHEVGAEDSIVDVVGAALLLDALQPSKVYCKPVVVGSGFVKTAHGRLAVPAPATQFLLQGLPTRPGPIEKEMTTPTGAAILRYLQPDVSIPVLTVTSSGLGAGSRDLPSQPNALRISLCEEQSPTGESVQLLQTNLDTASGEVLGADLLTELLEQGALDAWLTPILMKKGRPAHKLEVLCASEADANALSAHILRALPTLGVRRFNGSRMILERSASDVTTPFGKVQVKIHHLPDGSRRVVPEYESAKALARHHKIPVQQIMDACRKHCD